MSKVIYNVGKIREAIACEGLTVEEFLRQNQQFKRTACIKLLSGCAEKQHNNPALIKRLCDKLNIDMSTITKSI